MMKWICSSWCFRIRTSPLKIDLWEIWPVDIMVDSMARITRSGSNQMERHEEKGRFVYLIILAPIQPPAQNSFSFQSFRSLFICDGRCQSQMLTINILDSVLYFVDCLVQGVEEKRWIHPVEFSSTFGQLGNLGDVLQNGRMSLGQLANHVALILISILSWVTLVLDRMV